MGLDFGLENTGSCIKRKFRWLLKIDGISALNSNTQSVNALPPSKASRPSLTFKEMEVQHLIETVYYPSKPEWKPITLTLFDLKKNRNPVFDWIKQVYDTCGTGSWNVSVGNGFKKKATLEMYDGCGNTIESWEFQNAWPQSIDFGDLDMGSSEYSTIEITLRYDRAVLLENCV